MYKNFSYIFGLGVLLLLTACDNGDKKATDDKQKVAESQKLIHIQNEKTEPVKEISSKNQTESGTKDNDIYADINKPIESKIPSSETKSDVETGHEINIEEVKTEEDIAVPSQNEEPVANIESASVITVDSTPESNTEKVIQEEGPKSEETQPVDIVNDEPKVEEVQSTEVPNNAEPTVVANEGNTENSSNVPEVSVESNVPVVSEEPVEDKSSAEIRLDSEPAPVMDEVPVQEVVNESEPAPIMNESTGQEVVNESEPAPIMNESTGQEVVNESEPAPVMDESTGQEVVNESEPAPVMNEVPAQEVVNESEPAPTTDEAAIREVVNKTEN